MLRGACAIRFCACPESSLSIATFGVNIPQLKCKSASDVLNTRSVQQPISARLKQRDAALGGRAN